MKHLLSFVVLGGILFSFMTSVSFASNPTCPGVPATLTWSSTNSASCTFNGGVTSGDPSCNFSASSGGSQSVTANTSCTVNYTCTSVNGSPTAVATLSVVNGPGCCGTGSQVGLTVWDAGSGTCVAAPTGSWTPSSCPSSCGYGGAWQTCTGGNGLCSGSASYCPATGSCTVNGACSGTHYLCSAGNSVNNSSSAGYYTWDCNGISGGTNATGCSEVQPCLVSVGYASNNPPTCTPRPVTTISADSVYISYNTATNINWGAGSNSPSGCTAGGSWSGAKAVGGGTQTTGNITAASTYTLYCTNAGGNGTTVSVTVDVCPVGTPYRVAGSCVSMSGTISASPNPCLIAEGATTCNTSITWNTVNPIGTSNVTIPVNNEVFAGNGGTQPITLSDPTTFYLNNNFVTLATVAVPVRCDDGLYWGGASGCTACGQTGCTGTGGDSTNPGGGLICRNGSTNIPLCLDVPTVTVTLNNSTALFISNYANNQPRIRWNGASGSTPTSCDIPSGNWTNPSAVGSPYSSAALTAYTDPLNVGGTYAYSYRCTNGAGPSTATANVTVCPSATPVLTNAGGSCQGIPLAGLTITGNYSAAGVLHPTCTNSQAYRLNKNGALFMSGATPVPATINLTAADAGTYRLYCDYTSFDGHLFTDQSDRDIIYQTTAPDPIVSLRAAPASISKGSATVLTWTVMYPNGVQSPVRVPACKLSATPVCTGTCTTAQLDASSTVNLILRTGMTDANDPSGSRLINPNAVDQLPPVHAADDWRALGKKTINLEKSMDFEIYCGATVNSSAKVRVIVTSTNEG